MHFQARTRTIGPASITLVPRRSRDHRCFWKPAHRALIWAPVNSRHHRAGIGIGIVPESTVPLL